MSGSQGLKVLSFNVWGVFAAKHIKERMLALGARLIEFDIICLQEQFAAEDMDLIMSQVPRGLFHVRRFPSSFVGSGLTILSKYEITSAHFEPFVSQGRPESVLQGDYMAQKGVALARIRLVMDSTSNLLAPASPLRLSFGNDNRADDPSNVIDVLVYNTHLIAQYERYSEIGGYDNESNAAARLSQALNMAQFIVHTARPRDFIIVCGDFNAAPDAPEMKLILAFCHAHGINLHRSLIHDGRSNETFSDKNAFNGKGSYLKLMSMEEDRPVQLDHILVSTRTMLLVPFGPSACVAPTHHEAALSLPVGVVAFASNSAVPIDAQKSVPISDHYAVAARVAPFHPMKPPFFIGRDMVEPRLLDDFSRARETLTFAANFLSRAATRSTFESKKWIATVVLCVALPFVSWLSEGHSVEVWRGTTVTWPSWPHHPMLAAILGLWGGISLVIGLLNRRNDAVMYAAQSAVLQGLLAS